MNTIQSGMKAIGYGKKLAKKPVTKDVLKPKRKKKRSSK